MTQLNSFVTKRLALAREVERAIKRPRKQKKNLAKTALMLLLEQRFGEDIDKLLTRGSQSEVAEKLGISQSNVHYWRIRRGLQISPAKPGWPKGRKRKVA